MGSLSAGAREHLIKELVDWLEVERAAFAGGWARAGVSPSITVKRPVGHFHMEVERAADGHGQMLAQLIAKTENIEVSRLSLYWGTAPMAMAPSTDPPVGAVVQAYGDNFVAPPLAEEKTEDERQRYKPFFGRLMGDYLRKLPVITLGDLGLARTLAEDYLNFVEGEEITEVESLPIGGIAPPAAPLTVGAAELRPLTPEELGELAMRATGIETVEHPSAFPVVLAVSENAHGMTMTAFLSLRSRVSKDKRSWGAQRRMARLVLALQLLELDIIGSGTGVSWTEPGPRLGQYGFNVTLPRLAMSAPGTRKFASIDANQLSEALQLAELIPPGCFKNPTERPDLALHRFALATSQAEDAEAIIDHVVALEALLVPDTKTENTLRFRLNGARYLGSDAAERRLLYEDLGRIYDVRSELIHGSWPSKVLKKHDLPRLRQTARQLAARGLKKALREHWPTREELEAAHLA